MTMFDFATVIFLLVMVSLIVLIIGIVIGMLITHTILTGRLVREQSERSAGMPTPIYRDRMTGKNDGRIA